jgi:hypothetical protein
MNILELDSFNLAAAVPAPVEAKVLASSKKKSKK